MLSDDIVFLTSLPLPMHFGSDYRDCCGNQWTEFLGHNHMLILSCRTQVLLILVLPDLLFIITITRIIVLKGNDNTCDE